MTTKAIVPYRSSAIGGKPALYQSTNLFISRGQHDIMSDTDNAGYGSPMHYQYNSNNWFSKNTPVEQTSTYYTTYKTPQMSQSKQSFGQPTAINQQFDNENYNGFPPMKTTTFIRKLHPSEVFEGATDSQVEFEDGGIIINQEQIFDKNPEYFNMHEGSHSPKTEQPCNAIVPFKGSKSKSGGSANGMRARRNNSSSAVRMLSADQVDKDFHFTAEDFQQGTTTFFPAAAMFGQNNRGVEHNAIMGNEGQRIGGNDNSNARYLAPIESTYGCNNPNCMNCRRSRSLDRRRGPYKNQMMPMISKSTIQLNHQPPMNGFGDEGERDMNDLDEGVNDNRTTYGYAEFQAAREKFENICKPIKRASSLSRKATCVMPMQDCVSSKNALVPYNPQRANNTSVMQKAPQDVQSLQQFVVAEETDAGGVKKMFNFPSGEVPSDLTLLRAAVMANAPKDAFRPDEYQQNNMQHSGQGSMNIAAQSVQPSHMFNSFANAPAATNSHQQLIGPTQVVSDLGNMSHNYFQGAPYNMQSPSNANGFPQAYNQGNTMSNPHSSAFGYEPSLNQSMQSMNLVGSGSYMTNSQMFEYPNVVNLRNNRQCASFSNMEMNAMNGQPSGGMYYQSRGLSHTQSALNPYFSTMQEIPLGPKA